MCRECSWGRDDLDNNFEEWALRTSQYCRVMIQVSETDWWPSPYCRDCGDDSPHTMYPYDTRWQTKQMPDHYGHKGRERMIYKFTSEQLERQQQHALDRISKLYDQDDGMKLYRIGKELLRRKLGRINGKSS